MRVAVVIPCYKSKKLVGKVVEKIGQEVDCIIAVDDACPEKTGAHLSAQCNDPRLKVLYHEANKGVGGAVVTGYQYALENGYDIIVKIDSDGQMDPTLVPSFIAPILSGDADYTKGNRFYNLKHVRSMPKGRLIGNAGLSFLTKFSSGYWSMFDPTNGYTAIHRDALGFVELDRLENRYFFESDLLMRLNIVRAVVLDIPMEAVYEDEVSGLSAAKEIFPFAIKNIRNFSKRMFYSYFLRNFSIASINLVFGTLFLLTGILLGAYFWIKSVSTGVIATAGSTGLVVVFLLVGLQLFLSFLSFDFSSEPKYSLQKKSMIRNAEIF